MSFPKEVVQCPVCGEPRGGGSTCPCDGIACRYCGIGRCDRPISDQFDPRDGRFWHTPHNASWGLGPCPSCMVLTEATVGPQDSWPGAIREDAGLRDLVAQIRTAGEALMEQDPDQCDTSAGILAVYVDEAGRNELGLAGLDTPAAVSIFDGEPTVPGFLSIWVGTRLRITQERLSGWLDEHTTVTTWACPPSRRRREIVLELRARWKPVFAGN